MGLRKKGLSARQVSHGTADVPVVLTQAHLEQIRFLVPSEEVIVEAQWTKMKLRILVFSGRRGRGDPLEISKMNLSVRILFVLSLTGFGMLNAGDLKSGEYTISQSWIQERSFERLYLVSVPEGRKGKRPVVIFLHGGGGNARGAFKGFMRRHRVMARHYIVICPEGYSRGWNIVSERSKADDRGFIDEIIKRVAEHDNVQRENFSIIGSSNGAALVNQLAIECRLPNIRNYVSGVSPLNVYQHDGKAFKAKGPNNTYRNAVVPMKGKRLMNISGTEDHLVPYAGGLSRAIPAKGGKLGFVHAEHSTYLWAKAMGYEGEKLTKPSEVEGNLEKFSYLDGAVVHYKVKGEGHGAMGAIREDRLLSFLEGGEK